MTDGVIILAVGQRGSGKTSKIRQLAGYAGPGGPALVRPRRLLVCDPEGRWETGPRDVVVNGAGELLAALRDAKAEAPRRPFRIVYRDDAETMQLAGPGAAWAVRNVTLVLDELVWICHAHYLPPYLKRIIQVGRDRGIHLLGTTREPQEVHDLLFSQARLLYFFRVEPGNGLDRIRRRYRTLWEELPGLETHRYRTWGEEAVTGSLEGEGVDRPPAVPHRSKRPRRRQGEG